MAGMIHSASHPCEKVIELQPAGENSWKVSNGILETSMLPSMQMSNLVLTHLTNPFRSVGRFADPVA